MKRALCVVQTPSAFVQYVACNLLPWGYRFVVTGQVKPGQHPETIDAKLIQKYGCNLSRGKIAYRKSIDQANVRYIRCGNFWAMFATKGKHHFFDEHHSGDRRSRQIVSLSDNGRRLHFQGYSIGLIRDNKSARGGRGVEYRSHVSIGRSACRELLAELLDLSTKRSVEELRRRIYTVPYEPYGPVIERMREILYRVNRKRKSAGLFPIEPDCIRVKRIPVTVFERPDAENNTTSSKSTPPPGIIGVAG